MNGHEACVRLLIDAKAAVDAANQQRLHCADGGLRDGRVARVCSSTRMRRWMRRTRNGDTALMYAWSRGMRAFAHRREGGGGCGGQQRRTLR